MLRVAALTAGRDVPAARFRVRQLVAPLRAAGIDVRERYPALGAYPPLQRALRPLWAAGSLLERLPQVVAGRRADVTLLQRELLSTFVTLESLTARPRVLDVDDAIWVHSRGAFARRLAGMVDMVIAGNAYIAEWFGRWNRNVAIVPTAVDTMVFRPAATATDRPVIGWMGTWPGQAHLATRLPAIRAVLGRHPTARLRIVSERPPLPPLVGPQIEYLPWSAEGEVQQLQSMTVGLMPLPDDDFTRGKCSYKMLLSMACGLPVVVSPVGMNAEVLASGDVGFGPRSDDEWVDALDALLADPARAAAMGRAGRAVVERDFSVTTIAPRLAAHLRSIAGAAA